MKKFVTKQVQDGKKAKQVRFKQNQKPSEDLMILEEQIEQIELAREVMNKKAKHVKFKKRLKYKSTKYKV